MKKYLVFASLLCLFACKKNNDSSTPSIVGKWMGKSITIVYLTGDKELSRASYPTSTTPLNTSYFSSFYYLFDANGNFGTYVYDQNSATYNLSETGDKYILTNSNNSVTMYSATGSSAVNDITYTDNDNIILTQTHTGSFTINTGTTTAVASKETDILYLTRN